MGYYYLETISLIPIIMNNNAEKSINHISLFGLGVERISKALEKINQEDFGLAGLLLVGLVSMAAGASTMMALCLGYMKVPKALKNF